MCKKINRFFPMLMICYIGGAFSLGGILLEKNAPVWASLVMSQMLILVPVLLFAVVQKINIIKCLPYQKFRLSDVLLSLVFGYLLLPLIQLINMVSMTFTTNRIQESTIALSQYSFLVQLLLMAVTPAFVEEFVFRGMFFHSYRKNGVLPAAILSGAIFGIVHMNINQFLYACVLGFIFAMLVEATGSMYTSMAAHFAINSYSIIIMKLMPSAVEKNAEAGLDAVPAAGMVAAVIMILVLAIGCSALAFCVYRMLARRNYTWEVIKEDVRGGLKAKNGEKFITLPLLITIILCVLYMIVTEYFVY